LGSLDGRAFVYVAAVLNIELAEGILQAEYVTLLELRVFPGVMSAVAASQKGS